MRFIIFRANGFEEVFLPAPQSIGNKSRVFYVAKFLFPILDITNIVEWKLR